ncbi:fungal pheromone mating factor STE2 GPCR-domain-containing protein [Thelonectria olida]|uniref:Fungal pheromone mating factor STE2 GPCR-domain-containing protein n=1 Tax=Thelonectria olida TaxID=1576542 RepID=A0A9P8WIJ2_9HYPO|nr:fungal pheromone mating factor STE2 GPCR-domain-containing protein [Thelonectria olida]
MGDFDPYTQNVTFLAGDGRTEIAVPAGMIDEFHTVSVSICLNYGAQLGACLIMLAVLLVMTPSTKFRRPSTVLHISGLAICIVRMSLLSAYFPSHFNNFYAVWGSDYSHVPQIDFNVSVAATTFSLLLVIAVEAALMHQAWTMVKLWPTVWKLLISVLSTIITLYTIGWRIAFTVVQNETIINLVPPVHHRWVVQWAVIANAISICWFCVIFNLKLIYHLVSNHGVLPSYKAMTPMEILIATNGILMVVPVIFAGLEWAHFTNFESASLTLTSVAIILPLGTLAAQRIAHSTNLSNPTGSSSCSRYGTHPGTGSSMRPLKPSSIATGTTAQSSILSRCEAGGMSASFHDHRDSGGLELGKLSEEIELHGSQVRINRNLVQHEERI